ncbi:MAG: hypothetical protein P8X74_11415 [Reinekea sp.]
MGVARLFLFKLILVTSICQYAQSEELSTGQHQIPGYLGQIQAHTPMELESIFQRVDDLLKDDSQYHLNQPLALVLHGEEVRLFLRRNYQDHQSLVDQAARLEAFNAIDIQVCETWLRDANVDKSELPAFVNTVPYGPDREEELLEQGYEYF